MAELLISTGKVDLVTKKRDVLVVVGVAAGTELVIPAVVAVFDAVVCGTTETGGSWAAGVGGRAIPGAFCKTEANDFDILEMKEFYYVYDVWETAAVYNS